MSKEGKKDLQDILFGAEDVLDLAAMDGLTEENDEGRATEMLSFRVEKSAMNHLREVAETLGVGHTILARELLLAGLARLRTITDED